MFRFALLPLLALLTCCCAQNTLPESGTHFVQDALQPYVDSVVMVSKKEATGRNARPVATVATKTISDFTALRQVLRSASDDRVPAGV